MRRTVRFIIAWAALSLCASMLIAVIAPLSRAGLITTLSAGRSSGGGVFFNSGAITQQAPTWASSGADSFGLPKPSTLANLAGAGPHAFFQFYINALTTPQPLSMPVVTVNDPSIGDIFRIDLWPPGTPVEWWDVSGTDPVKYSSTFGVWTMRTLISGTVRGLSAFSNYITVLPRFNYHLNQLIQVFYQWDTSKYPLPPGRLPNAGNLLVTHFIKGQPSGMAVQDTRYGNYYPGVTVNQPNRTTFPNAPISPPWGATLDAPNQAGKQPIYNIGFDPGSLTALHGILGPVIGEFGRFPADPIGAVGQSVDPVTGLFRPPPPNGTGLANLDYNFPSAISLSGNVGYGGWNDNQGIQLIDTLELDTSMNVPDGYSQPGSTPDPDNNVPAANFFGSDD